MIDYVITKDRFDLEDDIMSCWRVLDDIRVLQERMLDGLPDRPDLTQDEIANILIGITELYQVKFDKMWDTFCQVEELDVYNSRRLKETLEKINEEDFTIDFDLDDSSTFTVGTD